AIGDWIPDLRIAVGHTRIGPVEILAALDVRLEVGAVIDRIRSGKRVEVGIAIAPIGEGYVEINAHEIDIGIGPQRVQVEEEIAAAIRRLMATVVRPVGGVAHLHSPTRNRLRIGGQGLELIHRRKMRGAVTYGTEPSEFRPDDESINRAD